jgi:hypothetical protein
MFRTREMSTWCWPSDSENQTLSGGMCAQLEAVTWWFGFTQFLLQNQEPTNLESCSDINDCLYIYIHIIIKNNWVCIYIYMYINIKWSEFYIISITLIESYLSWSQHIHIDLVNRKPFSLLSLQSKRLLVISLPLLLITQHVVGFVELIKTSTINTLPLFGSLLGCDFSKFRNEPWFVCPSYVYIYIYKYNIYIIYIYTYIYDPLHISRDIIPGDWWVNHFWYLGCTSDLWSSDGVAPIYDSKAVLVGYCSAGYQWYMVHISLIYIYTYIEQVYRVFC